MLIQPDTYIKLIKNCPLDNSYEHTIYFENKQEQEEYFLQMAGVNFAKNSYQRYSDGVLSVQSSIERIYNCNYLMFKNTSFENKWFYAFINKVEYVNNVTCRVYYEIDIMQTWFYDLTLKECFVEREHSETDVPGDNLVHEDIYFGPYVYGEQVNPVDGAGRTMQELSMVIMYNPTLLVDIPSSVFDWVFEKNFYGGVYQGVNFIAIPAYEENAEIINGIISAIDFSTFGGFLAAFMMPTMFLPSRDGFNEYNPQVTFSLNRNTSFGGYEPKNKKLFTYPYTCANLTANRNEGNDFGFEYFSGGYEPGETNNNTAHFIVTGNMSANPSVIAYPNFYKNVFYYTEGAVSIPSYPVCTWGADGVTEWINNNLFKGLATIGVSSALGVSPVTALQPGPVAGQPHPDAYTLIPENKIYRAYERTRDSLKEIISTPGGTLSAIGMARSEFDPGNVHGNVDGDVLMGTVAGREICARIKRITEQYAIIVDEYFTRFGYATMRVKVPNINKRKYWNYVKTNGCSLRGAAPADVISSIASIFDRGITFWKENAKIGVYTDPNQDNSI